MVGVPKSSGCKTCKKRRLKCDESWPECLRCQKIKQPCPGTSSLLIFKDGRPKTISPIATITANADASTVLVPLQSRCQLQSTATDLTVLDSKWSKSGALSQKWRIKIRQEPLRMAPTQRQEYDSALQTSEEQSSDFPEEFDTLNLACYPANSVRYRLTRAFIATLEVPEAGYRITSFGKYMRDIPRYVGESPALDAAAACLANAHSNVMQHPECRGKQVADPVLYLKALQRLQEAIVDPKTGMSTYTLAATILLGIVETLGGVRQDSKALSHAGGTTKLIEMRGPSNHLDDFANSVLQSQRGKIILQSLWSGTCCFLETEEWQAPAFMSQTSTETVQLHDKVVKHLTHIPRILKGYRELRSTSSAAPPLDTLFRLKEMRSSLTNLGYELEPRLYNGSIATEVPSQFGNTLVPIYWNFMEQSEATIYSHFWTLVIVVNQMFGEMTGTRDHEPICKDAAYNICKLYEHLWPYRPFANMFLVMSFSVAYPWLHYELQSWIVAALNELSGVQSTGAQWSSFDVEHLAGVFTGKVPPIALST